MLKRIQKRYIDVLHKLTRSYNHTWRRSIKMESAAFNLDNQIQIWKILYANDKTPTIKYDLEVEDNVRINKEELCFKKGYEEN